MPNIEHHAVFGDHDRVGVPFVRVCPPAFTRYAAGSAVGHGGHRTPGYAQNPARQYERVVERYAAEVDMQNTHQRALCRKS